MPKIVENRLTDRAVRATKLDGDHLDGRGLALRVKGKARSWVFRFRLNGRRRVMGLGSYPAVGLSMARERAQEARRLVADGVDPIHERRQAKATPTFARVIDEFMPGYEKEVVDAKRWLGRLRANVWKQLADRRIDQVDRDVLSRLLLDIHDRAPGTADKIAQALSRVFRFALGRGYIDANPLDAAKAALPRDFGSRAKRHHPMVQVYEIPAFYEALVQATPGKGELCALALRLLCLSGIRSGEIRHAEWSEFDGDRWRIPAERTKTRQPHIVPLTREMTGIIDRARSLSGEGGYVFPGQRPGRPLSDMSLSKRMKSLGFRDRDGRLAVPHGLRASLKSWAQDHTMFDPALVERVLGHAVRGDIQKAYDRAHMVEKRKAVLDSWGQFVTGASSDRVVQLKPG